jgi:hypothetical protein
MHSNRRSMKFKTPLFTIIASLLSLFVQAQDKVIVIGTGGGFSGAVTAYKITEKGEVFKGNGLAEIKYTLCAKIKKSKAKKLIQQASTEVEAIKDFNHPGNLYSFIAIESGNDKTRLTWGDNNNPTPEKIRVLHADILKAVSSLNYKPIKK